MFIVEVPIGLNMLNSYLNKTLGLNAFEMNDIINQLMDIVKIAKVRNHYISGDDIPEVVYECLSDLSYDVIEYLMFNLSNDNYNSDKKNDELYFVILNFLTSALLQFLASFDNIHITNNYTVKIDGLHIFINTGGINEL